MDDPHRQLLVLAATTHGLVTRTQARAVGMSAKRLHRLTTKGILEPVGSRALLVVGSPDTPNQRVLAACLETSGVATRSTAAAIRSLSGFSLEDPIEIAVRESRQSHRATRARIHTTRYLPHDHLEVVEAIPTLNVARTLLSLAAAVPEISEKQLADAIREAVRLGLAREPWLRWMLDQTRRRGRDGVQVFERILDVVFDEPITESWLESESLHILRSAGLPLPEVQARIAAGGSFLARVDFHYPGTRAIIEVNGHRFHASPEQLAADAERRRRLVAAGYQVFDFTYSEIVEHPERLVACVRQILGLPALPAA